ncbi:hypothetical protein L3X38_000030 [Prunus dulcis]|uniref:Uncharacterized protein n=1 Tax=Prunus dulcis TaxID=3755 RepID=A0AAD4YJ74_PRUDU|nr:hypothetical protein L3X38_000030 [Prunus dulcis]
MENGLNKATVCGDGEGLYRMRLVSQSIRSPPNYVDPPPAPLIDSDELKRWSFYRALIAEFIATLLFLYITVSTVIGNKVQSGPCDGVGLLGIAWASKVPQLLRFFVELAEEVAEAEDGRDVRDEAELELRIFNYVL